MDTIFRSSKSQQIKSVTKELQVPISSKDNLSDNMAKAIEMTSIDNLVKDSETVQFGENARKFEYKLDDKA